MDCRIADMLVGRGCEKNGDADGEEEFSSHCELTMINWPFRRHAVNNITFNVGMRALGWKFI